MTAISTLKEIGMGTTTVAYLEKDIYGHLDELTELMNEAMNHCIMDGMQENLLESLQIGIQP